MTEPEPQRRRRPAVSCTRCRRSKIRCDQKTPCGNCVRSKNATCVYQSRPSEPQRQSTGDVQATALGVVERPKQSSTTNRGPSSSTGMTTPSHPSTSEITTSTNASTPATQPSAWEIESMKSKIRQLEEQLNAVITRPVQTPASKPDFDTSTSRFAGTFHVHHEHGSSGQPQMISRSVTHKARTFGQSHWVNIFPLFQSTIEMVDPHREDTSRVISGMQRCKSLAKVIKSRRTPPWPTPPTRDLPPKAVADELVDCYLRTTEALYRVVHIPSFKRDYETVFMPDEQPDAAFLVQLKLVLAIGSMTYDDQFSLRTSAIQWVYEAQTWLSEPKFKSRLGIQTLQTDLLLLLAREMVGVSGEPIWISAGALLRRAMYIGLHKDPARLPKKTVLAAEMHRRLWYTILEVSLQSSLTSGGPPLVSPGDFDTELPGNFDDDQLLEENPVPRQGDVFTQTSIAIALSTTSSARLLVIKFLNDLASSGTYKETLRLDEILRASYRSLSKVLHSCKSSIATSASRYQTSVIDFIMHRYLSALHVPFFGPALHETEYAYSRKVVVETSLKIWYAAYPSSSTTATLACSDSASSDRDDLARLVACASGFYRTVAMQAALLISVEIRTQLQEEESFGPVFLRPDLLSVLDDAKKWCVACIKAGEVNIKGFLLISVVAAQIEGLRRGLTKEELSELISKAAEDSEEACLPLLEEMAVRSETNGLAEGSQEDSSNTPPEIMEDWDFMMSGGMFNLSNAEPMNWIFNDNTNQEQALW